MNSYISNETSKQSIVHACGVVETVPNRGDCLTRVRDFSVFEVFLLFNNVYPVSLWKQDKTRKGGKLIPCHQKSQTQFLPPTYFLYKIV